MRSCTRLTAFVSALAFLPAALFADVPPVHTVLFTHIEDNAPAGALPSVQSRQNYIALRGKLIDMANLARDAGVPWSLQPDWKILEAALLYEDPALMAGTNGKNFLRYLKEDLGAVIDPHSHENGGYNYTDVAKLLDSLGVGATTVIGGHIWDPSLPQFQEWDRFRVPVPGERYPWALWRGDILMGSGTPNHVNDPIVSGVWRPRDRDRYFEHDPAGNIAAIGQFRGTVACIEELHELYRSGAVPAEFMLTSSYHITPSAIVRPGGLAAIEDSVLAPIVAMSDSGFVVPTDFTTLVEIWQMAFGSRGFLYDGGVTAGAALGDRARGDGAPPVSLRGVAPNPLSTGAAIAYSVARSAWVRLAVFDVRGREVAVLADGPMLPGRYSAFWDAALAASGVYLCAIEARPPAGAKGRVKAARKMLVIR